MRESRTIELPYSKIKAEVASFLTFGEHKRIEAATLQASKSVRVEGGQTFMDVDASAMAEATKIAMLIAVVKLTTPEGTEIPVSWEAIEALRSEDGQALQGAVDAIDEGSKKK